MAIAAPDTARPTQISTKNAPRTPKPGVEQLVMEMRAIRLKRRTALQDAAHVVHSSSNSGIATTRAWSWG